MCVCVCVCVCGWVGGWFVIVVVHVLIFSQTSEDAAAIAVGYLIIFMSNITNGLLMREFLMFLTVGSCDDKPVLNCLLQNILSTNSKV